MMCVWDSARESESESNLQKKVLVSFAYAVGYIVKA
jgi:hypothetical protein